MLRRPSYPSTATTAFIAAGLLGCSDPETPPPQASARLSVTTHPTGRCTGQLVHNMLVPSIDGAPTRTSPGSRIADGQDGSEISCTVVRSGEGFAFSGSIRHGRAALAVPTGTIDASGKGQTVVSHFDPNTGETFFQQSCDVEALEIAEGRMWLEVTCGNFRPQGAANQICTASAVLVFENCST